MANALLEVQRYGQSLWYDTIRRDLMASGELQNLIDHDGLRGITSNPAIFEKAIAGSTDYDAALDTLQRQRDMDAKSLYEHLAIVDIQAAADVLASVYEQTDRRDGYVSLEVSPYLAHDTAGTIAEARRLWQAIGRNNVMIKVPATPAGLPALQQLISEGININVTLLFGTAVYEAVAYAFIAGLEAFVVQGGDPSGIASVASFFVSRIDAAVDQLLNARLQTTQDATQRALLHNLRGTVAIANARLAYQRYKSIFGSARWQVLADQGAQPQRLLWASTSTKNPQYRDVMYVEELIGPHTVNTLPEATLVAFRDHGQARASITEHVDEAQATLDTLGRLGISLQEVTNTLVAEGVTLFAEAFDKLLGAVARRRQEWLGSRLPQQTVHLPVALQSAVQTSLQAWQEQGKVRQLWARDAGLWTAADESQWLDWLSIVDVQQERLALFRDVAAEVQQAGFTHVLLLGMGGSSLAPEVFATTLQRAAGFPPVYVLDSTDPAQIKHCEEAVALPTTLCIVSSKSGSTLEPQVLMEYFLERLSQTVGAHAVGRHFIAITDAGSALHQFAESRGFRRVLFGEPGIGGRYSALSHFGMVPAAIMGVDVPRLLTNAAAMAYSCAASVPATENPGVILGTILGIVADQGRDKITLVISPALQSLGSWIEQLLAESTGKQGRGLLPIDGEPLGTPTSYGDDRLFVYIRLATAADATQDAAIQALQDAAQPVVRCSLADAYQLGAAMFCWEMATAVAGAILQVNPFDQPDVEASKVVTRTLTDAYEQHGSLPTAPPLLAERGVTLYADPRNAAALTAAAGAPASLVGYLKAHVQRLQRGDYFCLAAFLERSARHDAPLQTIRRVIRDSQHVATCLGYGPRFLHSTGQAYKGGPNSGVFLQITCDDAHDLAIPGRAYTFGVVKAAQAQGDLTVLAERQRRLLRVHLGADAAAGLEVLAQAIREALTSASA